MSLTGGRIVAERGLSPPCAPRGRLRRRGGVGLRASQGPTATSSRPPPAPPGGVRDGRLPFLRQLLQFRDPKRYAREVLGGEPFASGRVNLPASDAVWVADQAALRAWLTNEWANGVKPSWAPAIRSLLGASSLTVVEDPELHARLRQLMAPHFTQDAVARLLPDIQAVAARRLAAWAAQGPGFRAYEGARTFAFDVLTNHVLRLGMDDGELQEFSEVFKAWVGGFLPPAVDLPFLPFGKGMAARAKLTARIRAAMASPSLPASSLLARLRDEFGACSEVATDNTVLLLFAGFDTSSSSLTFAWYLLSKHPAVMQNLREEQDAVVAAHGPRLSAAAVADMPYTAAVIKETLRLSQIVAYVPRVATQPLFAPAPAAGQQRQQQQQQQRRQPVVPSGCPFIIALSAASEADPAVAADGGAFRPERWLDPGAARSLAAHQMPFGVGVHRCIGSNLAVAEMTALLAELARHWELGGIDPATRWEDFPIKKPVGGMPATLTPRANAPAAGVAAGVAAGAAAE